MLLVPRYPGTVAIRGAVRACRRVDVKGCFANRKIAFHEALYDARVYTIMVLTPWYSLGRGPNLLPGS